MDPPNTSDHKSCSTCGAGWQFLLLLAILLLGILFVRSRGVRDDEEVIATSSPADGVAATSDTATLIVDFGDAQPRQFQAIPWHEGMTIEDLLGAVSELPDGLEFAKQGSGASALLTRIGNVANEGAAGRNWTYLVNGQRGDRSFAIYELKPGDSILWKFGPQE